MCAAAAHQHENVRLGAKLRSHLLVPRSGAGIHARNVPLRSVRCSLGAAGGGVRKGAALTRTDKFLEHFCGPSWLWLPVADMDVAQNARHSDSRRNATS